EYEDPHFHDEEIPWCRPTTSHPMARAPRRGANRPANYLPDVITRIEGFSYPNLLSLSGGVAQASSLVLEEQHKRGRLCYAELVRDIKRFSQEIWNGRTHQLPVRFGNAGRPKRGQNTVQAGSRRTGHHHGRIGLHALHLRRRRQVRRLSES